MKKLILGLLFITLFLEIINIYLSNKVSTDSVYASNVKEKINEYEEQNAVLETESLKYASFHMLSSRAAELGFIEPKEFVSLYSPLEVAIKR